MQDLSPPPCGSNARIPEHIRLRPKTRLLLLKLLESEGRIVNKTELIDAVWGHPHVEDAALFQLIRDLRKVLGDPKCVQTFPGRGYRWHGCASFSLDTTAAPAASTKHGFFQARRNFLALAACLGAAIVLAGVWGHNEFQPISTANGAQLFHAPRATLLREALAHELDGDFTAALEKLKELTTRYPMYQTGHAERARLLFAIGAVGEALQAANDALSAARSSLDTAGETHALMVLSQLALHQGDFDRAQLMNTQAADSARNSALACEIEITQRVATLLETLKLKPTAPLEEPVQLIASLNDCSEPETHKSSV